MTGKLTDKVAIVTGGARDIGPGGIAGVGGGRRACGREHVPTVRRSAKKPWRTSAPPAARRSSCRET